LKTRNFTGSILTHKFIIMVQYIETIIFATFSFADTELFFFYFDAPDLARTHNPHR
jgi:hypothetical protein